MDGLGLNARRCQFLGIALCILDGPSRHDTRSGTVSQDETGTDGVDVCRLTFAVPVVDIPGD